MADAIVFDRVTKRYRGALAHRALHEAARGLLAGGRRTRSDVVALDDVSFEIPEGQSFALLGANGAGKTTALKLATRIAYPTTGSLRVRGRVGALIEVGTGMHPDLTGRENVSLYGRILGLSKREIDARFDEIVDFAGIGAAVDQQVKQYSSGMQLRLGFSVAAHLEPDVLIVDEAIAVGDAGFQYRCIERMARLVREGRTLVFVSHNTRAVETLCTRGILLSKGRIVLDGPATDVVAAYHDEFAQARLNDAGAGTIEAPQLTVLSATLHDASGGAVEELVPGSDLTVRLRYRTTEPLHRPNVNVGIVDPRTGILSSAPTLRDGGAPELLDGEGTIACTFSRLPLFPRDYEVWIAVNDELGLGPIVPWQRAARFRIVDEARAGKAAVTLSLTSAPVDIPYEYAFQNGGGDA